MIMFSTMCSPEYVSSLSTADVTGSTAECVTVWSTLYGRVMHRMATGAGVSQAARGGCLSFLSPIFSSLGQFQLSLRGFL